MTASAGRSASRVVEDVAEAGLGGELERRVAEAEAVRRAGGSGRSPPRRRRRSAGWPRAAKAAAACRRRVDLPMPGSPPTRMAEAGTRPPPRTRSSSAMPERARGSGGSVGGEVAEGDACGRGRRRGCGRRGRRRGRSAPRRWCSRRRRRRSGRTIWRGWRRRRCRRRRGGGSRADGRGEGVGASAVAHARSAAGARPVRGPGRAALAPHLTRPQRWALRLRSCGTVARRDADRTLSIGPSARPWMNWSSQGSGAVSMAAAGPCQRMRPSCSMATWSATVRTVVMSWVMVMAVAPISVTSSRMSALMTPARIGSRPAVGSSKKMTSGSVAMARARPTRFCMPPESSAGQRSAARGRGRRGRASRWRARGRPCGGQAAAGVDQAEGDVLPDGEAVEERAALEEHAEVAEEGARRSSCAKGRRR